MTANKPARKSPATKPAAASNEGYTPTRISRQQLVEALDIGSTHAESKRISLDDIDLTTYRTVQENLRNTMAKVADRAKQRTGGEYITETGNFTTRSGDMILVVAITRTA